MQRRPTLADVAERAGVSRALVSIVMREAAGASEQTRERVKRAADDIGYRPDPRARRLRQLRTNLLGLTFAAGQEFHADLVDGVYVAAEALGYDVVLSAVTPHRDEVRAVRTLVDDRCEGLLLIGPAQRAGRLAELADRVPLVVLARRVRGVDAVRSDDVAGARLGVEHLLGLGHRRILFLDGGGAPGAVERLRGYRRAMQHAGQPELIRPGGLTEREGAAAASAIVASGEWPDAVFAFNDRCALGVMDVFIRSGIAVPQDVSVLGYDDSALAGLAHINLSTLRQDAAGLAAGAVQRLVGRLEGPADGRDERAADLVREPQLIARQTTAPPTR
ncbi:MULTISPECIES: LacI family DNA-binding transcriptional regulator [Mycobacteriaceae]|uniref:LacI family transcriptional regulator n=1 Tax=Mycolicibacterium parafortuitum TaxID=39692 RepID=A0ACC6MG63_MYCPF|nr:MULTISPECIES: LacI family DNA-binding transcriptional regulator [Mycobacteriaceae]MDZ5085967.1 LacI family transcriptional regulator [Mycolicibacterium parafortuitum]GFM20087.1 transcriptional regulator [Mycobacterium sp. PO1]GFM24811.1 transcriptional regulator [Mycobacterium sp. PO2]